MKELKWIKTVFYFSTAATVLVTLWWAAVFHFISKQTGESLLSYSACLLAPTADCNLLRGMAWLQGINPYEPIAFWLALSLAVFSWRVIRALQANNTILNN
jgi:hypothetical protein